MPSPLDSSASIEAVGDPKSDQPARSVRPLSLYLKILAAAVALLVLCSPGLTRLPRVVTINAVVRLEAVNSITAAAAYLGTLILAPVAVLRMRSQGRDFSRSTGVSAILGAGAGVGLAFPHTFWAAIRHLRDPTHLFFRHWPYYLEAALWSATECSAAAIIGAWLILALTGMGRKPSNGFERIGLGLGVLWILVYVVAYIVAVAPWLL